jgi:hypothetical protein
LGRKSKQSAIGGNYRIEDAEHEFEGVGVGWSSWESHVSQTQRKKRKEEATPSNCSLKDVLGVEEKNPIVVGGCGLGNASGSSSDKYFL